MTEDWNPWGDEPLTDEELPLYLKWQESLHDFQRGEGNRCSANVRYGDRVRVCGGYSHDTNHLPMDCCYCEHGKYMHTSYDIPCGRCEFEFGRE